MREEMPLGGCKDNFRGEEKDGGGFRVGAEGHRLFTEFKGALSENYVLEAFRNQFEVTPRYWSQVNPPCEVDFIIQRENDIIPVEVKAEDNTEARSLKKYKEKFSDKVKFRVRCSLANLKLDGDLLNILLSMVAVGLSGDSTWNPGAVARYSEENGFLDGNAGTAWSLMSLGAEELGLSSREISLDEGVMIREVLAGNPIICSMRPGDFKTEGHFIVLCGYEDDNFMVNDPNSRTNSEKGWSFSTLQYQIKNLWAFSA